MNRILSALCLSLAISFVGPAARAADAGDAADVITAERLREHIAELSSDAYAGRGPGTEGDRMARRYMADQLAALGFEPAGPDGSWEQPMGIIGINSYPPETWTFRSGDAELDLTLREEFMAVSGVQQPRVSLQDAEIVFVGYGIRAPEEDWNDYKGQDLTGKVLLMLNNDPHWDEELFAGTKRLYYGRWTYKYEIAAEMGAAGCIIIHTTPSAGYGWNVVQSGWSGVQFELPAAAGTPRLTVPAWVTWDAAVKLAELGGHDLDALVDAARQRSFRPVPLGVKTSLDIDVEVTTTETANVWGILEGSDPELSKELVVYTAHHDHLGVGEPDDEGDAIYNGALDNAAGVSQVLTIAKAFTELPQRPRRSILILPVGAEESGLLGSRFFAENPLVHPGYLAANINIDGGNIFGRTHDVAVVGLGKSTLEDALIEAAARQGREVVNEPYPDKGYYYRSDQLNFARIGVPALYFKSGNRYVGRDPGWGKIQEDRWREAIYHQPGDELTDDWDFQGMVDDARLAFQVGLAVANAPELPAWRPGDEFEAQRLEALESRAIPARR